MQEEQILEFVEKPKRQDAPSNLINAGFYVLEPEVLAMIPAGRAMFEYDIFPRLAAEGKLFGYEFDGQWLDTGTPERLAKAEHEWKGIGI
jgi:mannose-1-phosphate guanylyltransferase